MRYDEERLVSVIKRAMPAVVSIVVTKSLKELEKEMPEVAAPTLFGYPSANIPQDKIDAHGRVEVGGGSGFIVDVHGIVLTNRHVISESHAEYTVIMSDGIRFDAEVLASDPLNDVSILKIQTKEQVPFLALGDSDRVELGQTVLAIGNALGLFRNTVSRGIVSGLFRAVSAQADPQGPVQEMRGLIQTDAAINPGNSGGPLIDLRGRVIGINTAVASGAQSIGFAIPIHAASRDLHDLKKYGRVRRPLLGVRYLTLSPDLKDKLHLPIDYGAFVTRENPRDGAVIPGTPANHAGIQEGDVICEWNGERITVDRSIQDYLENSTVNEVVALKVLRGEKELTVRVTLAERK